VDMTPMQHAALRDYRDRGAPIRRHLALKLIRDGHLTPDGVIITNPDSVDARTQAEKVRDLTIEEAIAATGLTRRQVYQARRALGGSQPRKLSGNLDAQMQKYMLKKGRFHDFARNLSPDHTARILDHAINTGASFLAAAAELLSRDPP